MRSINKLNLTNNPATSTNGDLLYARNVVATRDFKAIRNEDGFNLVASYSGNIIGKIDLPDGYVLFINDNPDKIVWVSDNTTKTITSTALNFAAPITGRYTYNSTGELIVTFTEGIDGANETRVINLSKSPTVLDAVEVAKLNLIPDIAYPTLTNEVMSNGDIPSGIYQVCIAYMLEKGNYTNYSILSEPIYVFGSISNGDKIGDKLNRSISISLAGLDSKYTKYKIGLLYKGLDEFEACYETDDISIDTTVYKITTLNSLNSTSIAALTVGNISYIKDNSHTSFGGMLLRANVKTIDYTGLDDVMKTVADRIAVNITWRQVTSTALFPELNIKRHFKEGEQYALYIGCIDYKGNLVNIYPIYWKTTDQTQAASLDTTPVRFMHQIPYDTYADGKRVCDLTLTLPNGIDTILGDHATTIKSFVYFYAEHDLNNSKVLGQGFAIRDIHINDFNDSQNYRYAFKSNTKIRWYSFEHLFNKSQLSGCYVYNSRQLGGFTTTDMPNGVNKRQYVKIFPDIASKLPDKINRVINKVEYISPDNVTNDNIAGDSYHRLTMSSGDIDSIFGSNPAQTPNTGKGTSTECYGYYETDPRYLCTYPDNPPQVINKLMAIFDICSNRNYFIEDVYAQKLAICSAIIPKTKTTATAISGDFFFDNFTIRCTTPTYQYKYGTNDLSLQDEDYVFKVIISIGIESRYNIRARFSGANTYQKVFNMQSNMYSVLEPLYDIPYKHDNFINTAEGKGYSMSCHYNGYDNIVYDKELDVKCDFPNRVIRSAVNSVESDAIGWRNYAPNSYKDFPIDRKSITLIDADDKAVYIQQEHSLYTAFVKDVISSTDEGDTYVGTGDIFDRDPIELMYDKNGYIGCDNRFGGIVTPFGYVVVDSIKKNIFLCKVNQATKITTPEVEQWFRDNLISGITNPYNKAGIALLYDDDDKSIYFTQQSGTKDFTIQYNAVLGGWLSFHDYVPEAYIATRTKTYCVGNNKIYKRHHTTKCVYFDTVKPSVAVYLYNLNYEVYKQILSINWDTVVRINGNLAPDITVDKVMLFNDSQCTGDVIVNSNANWFDNESGIYKKDIWYFNQIKDITRNGTTFIDDKYNVLADNLDYNKNWFDNNNFLCKYVGVKFTFDNTFVSPTDQASFILNGYDVNATKALR